MKKKKEITLKYKIDVYIYFILKYKFSYFNFLVFSHLVKIYKILIEYNYT